MNTLIIDNYDSFTYNLYHMFGEVTGCAPVVIKNDEATWRREQLKSFDLVIISPGPGHPAMVNDMGISNQVLQEREIVRPLLGVCLGHQGMCHQLGGRVERAPEPAHGRIETILHIQHPLFNGIPETFDVVRYHSLIVSQVPPDLMSIAWTLDGLVMAVSHRTLPMWGVQFHPESACCQYGRELAHNVCALADQHRVADRVLVAVPRGLDVVDRPAAPEGVVRHLKLFARPLQAKTDTEAAFLALQGNREEPAIWLDSNDHGSPLSSVSVIASACGPDARVVQAHVVTGHTQWRRLHNTEWVRTHTRFFDWMSAELQCTRVEEDGLADALPFEVRPGWFGYLGYELKAETGGALAHEAELPDAWMFYSDRILVHDHRCGQWWALAVHDFLHEPSAVGLDRWVVDTDELLAAATAAQQPIEPMPVGRNLTIRHSTTDYTQIVAECLREIQCGESYELCLTNDLRFDLEQEADDLSMYRWLRQRNPTSFSCFLRGASWSVLSLSPERFMRVDQGHHAQSRPMKGTRPRGADPLSDAALRDDLATNAKDRAENLMILDLVRNDLGRCARLGCVKATQLFEVESYATVHQMTSTVEARLLDATSSVEIVRQAFPPGSMTGAPKIRSMAILDRLEAGPRGVYSGTIGYFALNGAADFNVVIRTLVKIGPRVQLGCGGAIIALSDPHAELEETMVKSRALLSAFGLTYPTGPAVVNSHRVCSREVPAAWWPRPMDDAVVEAALTQWLRGRNAGSRLLLAGERGAVDVVHKVLAVFEGLLLHLPGHGVPLGPMQAASLQCRHGDEAPLLLQGRMCQVDDLESDAVFSALQRTEQIRAWVHDQPDANMASVIDRYAGQAVARPKTFRVYRLTVWRLHEEMSGSAAPLDKAEIQVDESVSRATA